MNCYNCKKARIDNNGVVCHYFETPYQVYNPSIDCKLMKNETESKIEDTNK